MKKIISFAVCTILLLILLLPTGCITRPVVTSDGKTNIVQTLDLNKVARIAGSAAFLGGSLDLARNPTHRPAFVAAVEALKSLESSKNYDSAALAMALQGLNIRELKGDGVIYIQAALIIWDETMDFATPVLRQELVVLVLPQIRSGLEKALMTTAPPPPAAAPARVTVAPVQTR